MAVPDRGIKKVIIPKAKLPGVFANSEQNKSVYILRYRFISEDKNRTSHWSPTYKIIAEDTAEEIMNAIVVNNTNKIINIVWEPQPNISEYDIYVKWNHADPTSKWEFYTKTSQTNYSIVYGQGKTSIKIAVQKPTLQKERFATSTLFENDASLI
ncbi:MAG: hypothetical protein EB127_04840 [Alphaproteobacteria bacterium]|nr:hypothetical protein [Alphaproteobacteria bacterium]